MGGLTPKGLEAANALGETVEGRVGWGRWLWRRTVVHALLQIDHTRADGGAAAVALIAKAIAHRQQHGVGLLSVKVRRARRLGRRLELAERRVVVVRQHGVRHGRAGDGLWPRRDGDVEERSVVARGAITSSGKVGDTQRVLRGSHLAEEEDVRLVRARHSRRVSDVVRGKAATRLRLHYHRNGVLIAVGHLVEH